MVEEKTEREHNRVVNETGLWLSKSRRAAGLHLLMCCLVMNGKRLFLYEMMVWKSHFIQLVAARIQLSVCCGCCAVRLEEKTYYYGHCYVVDRGQSACYSSV